VLRAAAENRRSFCSSAYRNTSKQVQDRENDSSESKNMKPKQKRNVEKWSRVKPGNLGTEMLKCSFSNTWR